MNSYYRLTRDEPRGETIKEGPAAGLRKEFPTPDDIGTNWIDKDLALLTQIRTDNPNLSQRGFAREVLGSFPGRTFNGVYHKVRILDLALSAAMGDIVATEIG